MELLSKKAIDRSKLPAFLTTWLDRASPDCMFTATQLKNWTSSHLKACPWYLDCKQGFIPADEEALFETLNECAIEPDIDEFASLDDKAKSRAIQRREAANKRKVDKLEEARKLSDDTKKRKLEKLTEKESKKGKRRLSKRQMEKKVAAVEEEEIAVEDDAVPMEEPTPISVDKKEESSGYSLTEERFLYGPSPYFHNIAPVEAVDECILNVSIADLLGTECGPTPAAYKEAIIFLDKVNPPLLQKSYII